MASKKTARETTGADPGFLQVVDAFSHDRRVSRGNGKGFGAGALKVNGKIFAMTSSKGDFVVKLPKEQVAALIASGQAEYFDPGHGRLMKEWVTVLPGKTPWIEVAREACCFVAGASA